MVAPPKPPAEDALELLIREARERQLRRRLIGAAGVAIAAGLGLSVYAFATVGNANIVSPAGAGRASAPLCRASQLSARAEMNGAAGTMDGGATLTNVSESACSLPGGRPSVRMVWRGRIVPTQEIGEAAGDPPIRVLAAHSKAVVAMDWSNWCGKPSGGTIFRIRPTFLLRFAGGLRVDAPGWVATPPRCGGSGARVSMLAVSRPFKTRYPPA